MTERTEQDTNGGLYWANYGGPEFMANSIASRVYMIKCEAGDKHRFASLIVLLFD